MKRKVVSYWNVIKKPILRVNESKDSSTLNYFFRDMDKDVTLYCGDTLEILEKMSLKNPEGVFDSIFADPPYFLSNNGITCQNGKMVSVNKGLWDQSRGIEKNHEFNFNWLKLCQKLLKPNGTIWVTGTHHVIFSVGYAMQQLGYKILNDIAWEKPNPPPNLSCRYFTHSTETVIWAAKNSKSKHVFHYQAMRKIAGGRQMKTVWKIYPPALREKKYGKHPTQKPVELIERCVLASTNKDDLILDPFMGSGSSLMAASKNQRRFVGIDKEKHWLNIAIQRLIDKSVQNNEIMEDNLWLVKA